MRGVIRAGLLTLACMVALSGCGTPASENCQISSVFSVRPNSATADHTAAAPGNQAQFQGIVAPTSGPGCPIPAWLMLAYGTWTNPDPSAIQISSASDTTNGLAVCKAATSGAVTLTGTFSSLPPNVSKEPVVKTVQLTCN